MRALPSRYPVAVLVAAPSVLATVPSIRTEPLAAELAPARVFETVPVTSVVPLPKGNVGGLSLYWVCASLVRRPLLPMPMRPFSTAHHPSSALACSCASAISDSAASFLMAPNAWLARSSSKRVLTRIASS